MVSNRESREDAIGGKRDMKKLKSSAQPCSSSMSSSGLGKTPLTSWLLPLTSHHSPPTSHLPPRSSFRTVRPIACSTSAAAFLQSASCLKRVAVNSDGISPRQVVWRDRYVETACF